MYSRVLCQYSVIQGCEIKMSIDLFFSLKMQFYLEKAGSGALFNCEV